MGTHPGSRRLGRERRIRPREYPPPFSTGAVLTEAIHLLSFDSRARVACLEFFLRGAVVLVPADLKTIERAGRLMAKYEDIPMDYADATLVVLAEDLETEDIFTLDRRGFTAYRWKGRKAFRILP